MFSACCWEDYHEEENWYSVGFCKVTYTCGMCKKRCDLISQKDINKQLRKNLKGLKNRVG
jgi:hypothetical protein